jgi:transcriptional regulator with XRE-family HTH domain
MKKRDSYLPPHQILLGELIMKLREANNLTRKEFSRKIRVTDQQLTKYEAGEFVPMAMLETIAKTLDAEIPKRIIRRISAAREREKDGSDEIETLEELYREAFEDVA